MTEEQCLSKLEEVRAKLAGEQQPLQKVQLRRRLTYYARKLAELQSMPLPEPEEPAGSWPDQALAFMLDDDPADLRYFDLR
jgi:hypothetical protein